MTAPLPDHLRFNLGYLGLDTARSDPGRLADIDEIDGAQRAYTYAELNERLDRVAALYTARGLRRGDRVAILVGNRREFIEATSGALRAGLVPVMVNTKLGAAALQASIEVAGAAAVVVEPACNDEAVAIVERSAMKHRFLIDGRGAGWTEWEAAVTAQPAEFAPIAPFDSTSIADLCFTSGSSGRPKAVMTSHRAILMKLHIYGNLIRWMVGGEIRTLVALPIFHANGRLSIGSALETGGLIVIQQRFDARAALENITGHRITYFLGVAPAYAAMLKEKETLARLDFRSLRYLWVGSASSSGEMLRHLAQALDVEVLHTYGSTEAGVVLQAEPRKSGFASCGRPIPGVAVKLLDPVSGAPAAKGELWIKNEWLGAGYWGQPALTAEKFAGGWYRSGDLFEADAEGNLYFRGRVDDTFNVGGEKVHPTEVENLLQQHPKVLSAVVVPIPHDGKGEVPAAMVIRVAGDATTAGELKAYCLAHGAAYAHPRRIAFIDAFPVATTGKVDRRAIRDMLAGSGGAA